MLSVLRRLGFTLPEIMISALMTLIVSGVVYQLLTTTQRLSRAQVEQMNLQANVRTGSLVAINDLRESSTVTGGTSAKNDILSIATNGLTYRAMRGIGFLCQPASPTQIRFARNGFSGYRNPQAGRDSAFVFLEGSAATHLDDAWLPVAITTVSTAAACPGTSGPAITLTTAHSSSLDNLPVGTPVRIFEIMELKLYQAEGTSWLGARSVSAGEAIQPVLGPLSHGNGFRIEYLGAGGAVTNDLTAIRSIRVTLRAVSEGVFHPGGGEGLRLEEELTAQVALRNAHRP